METLSRKSTKPNLLGVLSATVVAGFIPLVIMASPAQSAPCPNPPAQSSSDPAWKQGLLCLVNHQRARYKRHQLRMSPQLNRGAQAYTNQMVGRHFFSHVTPSGGQLESRVRASGYTRHMYLMGIGENIYWTGMPTQTPQQAFTAWMNSPHHRENMLDPSWRDFGAGITAGNPLPPSQTWTSQGWTMSQWFGIRSRT